MTSIDLTDKVAIVTGGASGIGFEIVSLLSQDGAHCVVWDNDVVGGRAVVERLSGTSRVSFQHVDITSEASITHAIAQGVGEYGNPNILVNNAGILGKKGKLWEFDPGDWFEVVENNLMGCFLVSRFVIPYMLETDFGRIVNISSVSGKDGSIYASPYSASKAGVIALTKALAKELADYGILVNCVTPSATDTPLFRAEPEPDRMRQLSKIPLKRPAQPIEVARVVEWLCSDLCSFSTGAIFDVSGGRSSY